MTTTIREITPRWKAYEPSDGTNVSYASVGAEKQIRWGIALEGGKSGLGFEGTSPPAQQLDLGQEFVLGTLRHFNHPLAPGSAVSETTLEITLVYSDLNKVVFDLVFEIEETPNDAGPPSSDDIITTKSNFPISVDVDGTKLDIIGFKDSLGAITDEMISAEGGTNSIQLVAKLVATPKEEEHCVEDEFEPVFQPERCTVPPVCPISPEPIVEDCGIPLSPAAIIDCPEIDIPSFAGIASPGVGDGGDGGDGPPGPPGPPGLPGCTPVVTVSYQTQYVHDCGEQRIAVIRTELPPCDVHLHFIFYLCYTYYYANDCCVYICCSGVWSVLEGGVWCQTDAPPATTPSPGYDGPAIILPPTMTCDDDGLTLIKCPCDYTTPPPRYCVEPQCGPIGDCGLMENVMDVANIDGDCVCEFDPIAIHDGDKWVANSPTCDDAYIALSCLSEASGRWQMVVSCNGDLKLADVDVIDNLDDTCSFVGAYTIGNTPPNTLGLCCPGSGTVVITFVGTKCDTSTTPPPPACVETQCGEGECMGIPGVIGLAVGAGSVCTWPATATYNTENGCWEATTTDCDEGDSGSISICCKGGVFTMKLTENGVTNTVNATDYHVDDCFIQAKFDSPFPSAINVTAWYEPCGTTQPPGDGNCAETVCAYGDSHRGSSFEYQGTIQVTDIGDSICCEFSPVMTYNETEELWESQTINCPGLGARITLKCDGNWTVEMTCGNATGTTIAAEEENNDFSEIYLTAYLDSAEFSGDCCIPGGGFQDIFIYITLKRCCQDDHRKCHWFWNGSGWDLDIALKPCLLCNCLNREPALPEGELAIGTEVETDASCNDE